MTDPILERSGTSTSGSSDRVRFNVGGTQFLTARTTIANAGPDSMLSSLLHNNWRPQTPQQQQQDDDEIFIDRNPAYFSVLLDLLRTGELRLPHGMPPRHLIREALYYGLDAHIRSATWDSPLDGNRADRRAAHHIPRCAPHGEPAAIRASPGGGCGVSHGPIIHLYDWSLERLRPITLDFMNVQDFCFLSGSPSKVIVCATDRGELGGLGLLSSTSGKLEQRFRLGPANFLARACASGSDEGEIFASSTRREKGIGMWDVESSKHLAFFPLAEGGSKLEWPGPCGGSLMVSSMFPMTDHCYFTLLDPRSGLGSVWDWSDRELARNEALIMDAVAIPDRSMICVVDQYDNLGFLDIRMNSPGHQGVHWSYTFPRMKRSELKEHSYSRLRINSSSSPSSSEGLQIFSSRDDAVLVYSCSPSFTSGSLPIITSTLASEVGGPITDMDVGGDRLFVLHSDESVFEVWETPVNCGIHL